MNHGAERAVAGQKVVQEDLVKSLYVIKDIAETQLLHSQVEQDQAEQLSQVRNALNSTLRQASRAIETIQYLRDIGTPHPALDAEQVDAGSFCDVLTEALRVIHEDFPLRNITILKIIPHDFPPFPVSREHLETILFQLVFNARRAIGEASGLITIEVQHYLYLTAENTRARHFHIRVADTGQGIREEEFPHLFDPFFLGASPAVNHLGLYMVKKLVDLNRGTVRVESSSKGTAFYLDFAA